MDLYVDLAQILYLIPFNGISMRNTQLVTHHIGFVVPQNFDQKKEQSVCF